MSVVSMLLMLSPNQTFVVNFDIAKTKTKIMFLSKLCELNVDSYKLNQIQIYFINPDLYTDQLECLGTLDRVAVKQMFNYRVAIESC